MDREGGDKVEFKVFSVRKCFLEPWRRELDSTACLPFQPHFGLSSFSLSDSISALCPANSEAGGCVHSLYCSTLIRSS